MIKEILEKHGVYTCRLELALLRHFEKLRKEIIDGAVKEAINKAVERPYNIGDYVEDDEGEGGVVVINWDDGLSPVEECAAHNNIKVTGKYPEPIADRD